MRIHDDEGCNCPARTAQGKAPTIRIGLAGFETNLFGATTEPNAKLFEPCPNVALASLRLQKLRTLCGRLEHHRGHETWCAIALWNGSWEHMNTSLADRVMTSIAVGTLANPELPTGCNCMEIASKQRISGPNTTSSSMKCRAVKPQVHVRDSSPTFFPPRREPRSGIADKTRQFVRHLVTRSERTRRGNERERK